MRIACIHIPQFALQCATRLDPAQRGAAVAVVSTTAPASSADIARSSVALHAPIVVACSRAAWAAGVRLGMTATAVRQLRGEIAVTTVEPNLERETVRAIAESVLGLTGVVDLGGRAPSVGGIGSTAGLVASSGAHLAMYAEVPAKTRGHAFGERVLERLEELGLTGRVGIADDRFTAWVAAAHAPHDPGAPDGDRVTMVPRGGSAAFLAPRPLSLLAISAEVQHMLEALGVSTLGEFAALPAPSVSRSRASAFEADYQALARGDSGTLLRPYAPEAAIREDIVVRAGNVLDAPTTATETGVGLSGPAAIALVARRLAVRLAGRGRVAAKLELLRTDLVAPVKAVESPAELARLAKPADPHARASNVAALSEPGRFESVVTLSPPTAEAEDLARVLAPALDAAGAAWRLRVVVVGEALAGDEVAAADRTLFTLSQELGMPAVELALAGRQVALAATRASNVNETENVAATAPAAFGAPTGAQLALGSQPVSRASESLATAARTATPHATDPLSVVLSTPGTLFALSSPGTPRRELRGLRRGKARAARAARRGRAVTMPGQSRLFERG